MRYAIASLLLLSLIGIASAENKRVWKRDRVRCFRGKCIEKHSYGKSWTIPKEQPAPQPAQQPQTPAPAPKEKVNIKIRTK